MGRAKEIIVSSTEEIEKLGKTLAEKRMMSRVRGRENIVQPEIDALLEEIKFFEERLKSSEGNFERLTEKIESKSETEPQPEQTER